MAKRIQKLKANRLSVLKDLLKGGRVEKRRAYPFPEAYHLKRFEVEGESAPKVAEYVMVELIDLGLIAPSQPVDLNTPGAADNIDYVATPAGHRAVRLKGIEYEDTQDALFDESVGAHDCPEMEAA